MPYWIRLSKRLVHPKIRGYIIISVQITNLQNKYTSAIEILFDGSMWHHAGELNVNTSLYVDVLLNQNK
jgi:hypothetical protein